MLKRVSAVALTLVMLLTMLCTFSVASAEGVLGMTVASDATDGVVKPGQKVTLVVSLENYSPMEAINVNGSYDNTFFSNVKVRGTYDAEVPGVGTVQVPYVQNPDGSPKFEGNGASGGGTGFKTIWADAYAFPSVEKVVAIEMTVADTVTPGTETTVEVFFGEQNRFVDETYTCSKEPVRIKLAYPCTHDWSGWSHNEEPNYADSSHTRTCNICGETETVDCDLTVKHEGSCGEKATAVYDCTVCGAHYEVEGEVIEHEWGTPVWDEDAQTHTSTCSKCGETKTDACSLELIQAVPATCTEDGYEIQECTLCAHQYKFVNEGSATGHTWEHQEGTTEENAQHVCSRCQTAVACTFDAERTEATCTEDAYTTYTCTVCSYSYKAVETGTAGHKYGDWTHVEGTETHQRTCSVCSNVETEACTMKVVEKATCVADGKEACSVCGYEKTIPALGDSHQNFEVTYKAPTDDASGEMKVICTDCDTVVEETTYEAGQRYEDLTDDSNVWYYDAAIFCNVQNNIFIGEYGAFNGDDPLTRGQIVTVLGRLMGYKDDTINNMTEEEFEALLAKIETETGIEAIELKDLNGSYYDRYAVLLSHMGIVLGHDDQTFRGDDLVTREELAAFILRMLDYTNSDYTFGDPVTFKDMDEVSEWAKDIVTEAGRIALFVGDEGNFDPRGNATRAEMAVLAERIIIEQLEAEWGPFSVVE